MYVSNLLIWHTRGAAAIYMVDALACAHSTLKQRQTPHSARTSATVELLDFFGLGILSVVNAILSVDSKSLVDLLEGSTDEVTCEDRKWLRSSQAFVATFSWSRGTHVTKLTD